MPLWLERMLPACFHPSYTRPHQKLGAKPLASHFPWRALSSLRASNPFYQKYIAPRFHSFLHGFSYYYCKWYGVEFRADYAPKPFPLPFGLLLKWVDGTHMDEVRSMAAIHEAGIPSPKVISYAQHVDEPVSIVMTRLPGHDMCDIIKDMDEIDLQNITEEFQTIFTAMHSWVNPFGESRLCSISGNAIHSLRIPPPYKDLIQPCEGENEFTEDLLAYLEPQDEIELGHWFVAMTLQNLSPHKIVFGHGDFALRNILVHEGHVSGFTDWECAGWYPEYWDFTTALRWIIKGSKAERFVMEIGGHRYRQELAAEMAIRDLSCDVESVEPLMEG